MTLPKDYFNREESLQEWIESDAGYKATFHKHKSVVRSNITFTTQLPFYMKLNNNLKRTLAYLGAHTAVAVTIGLLAVTTISASAAELAAPTEFKPSTLIKGLFQPTTNLQDDTDPNKELIDDPLNSIVKLYQCGITVKYPKKIEETQLTSTLLKDHQSPTIKQTLSIDKETTTTDSAQIQNTIRPIYVNCATEKFDQVKGPDDQEIEITKEKLKSFTGWFVADADLQDVTDLFNTSSRSHLVRFEYNNSWYALGFTETDENAQVKDQDGTISKGIFGNQIQIQLADQVTNQVLTTPQEITKNLPAVQNLDNSNNATLTQSEKSKVSKFDACNSAVQYNAPSTSDPTNSGFILRYYTKEDGALDTSALELIAKHELDNGDNYTTLKLECSTKPFDLLPNADVIDNKNKDGLFLTKETLDKATISRVSEIDAGYGIELESKETQLEKRIVIEYSLDGVYFRQSESIFIEDTTNIDYSQYPFFYVRRLSPDVRFQSTILAQRPANDTLTPISTEPLPVVTLAPAQSTSLIKTYNHQIENTCSLDGIVTYSTVPVPVSDADSSRFALMSLANRLQANKPSTLSQLSVFDSFLNKGSNDSTTSLFSDYCGGYYSFYMYDVPVTYLVQTPFVQQFIRKEMVSAVKQQSESTPKKATM